MKIRGLSVEIGSEKYELPEIRSDLLGQGLKEIVRYKTHQQVDFLYIKSLDKYVDDYKTLSEMNIVDRDVFIGSFYESSFDLDNTNNINNINNLNNNNNNFNGISNFYHNAYNNYRKKWENCLTGSDEEDDENNNNNFIIDDEEEDDKDDIPDIETDFSPLYISKRYTDISDYLKSDDPFHVVNLFHIISIICCILSLFVWFTELIPCALSWMVFEVAYNYEVLTKKGRALLWADIIVTLVVFGILLTIFIGLVVNIAEVWAILFLLLVPYLYVISVCFVSIECDCFA